MLGDAIREPVTLAGAFVLGAVLTTIALLRIIRALATMFEEIDRRRHRRWEDDP